MTKLQFDENTDPSEFRAIRLLGVGSYGQVIEVVHVKSGKHLAGKLIKTDQLDAEAVIQIKKEISIMKGFFSKYIVNYYGTIRYPKVNPRIMILMDYCDRGSIRDLMDSREKVLTEDQISIIMHDLLNALTVLHDQYHTIHRDIKAANILISSDYSIKVTDFGVSRQFDPSFQNSMKTVSSIGTPYWMAPEVIDAERYSFPVDIWSVGATAIELAEGVPPYTEFAPTVAMQEICLHGFQGFRPTSKLSKSLQDFIIQCTQKDPASRPTAKQLLEHPFVKQAEKLSRKEAFEDILKEEIDFDELLDDESINEINQIIELEKVPVYNPDTSKSENRKTHKSFVTPVPKGTKGADIYVKEVEAPPQKPASAGNNNTMVIAIAAIIILLLAKLLI
ncbi:STE family protein kinase [Tritrichomonas foetus]|uniref:non-specific serine/threonine protein kinase n=1 Tax=Tritrichomonas foetus TaxID=1144522 RepID=A0A1J4KJH8_9EUKA|nr:STE family protein kinase [Tritrichomonas foetus]|eukprot:OHT09964.1 STE family protein kinase [Tritrichomonas foetus]